MLLLYYFSEHKSELKRINPTLAVARHRNQFASWFDEWISYFNIHHDLRFVYIVFIYQNNLLIILLIIISSTTYR